MLSMMHEKCSLPTEFFYTRLEEQFSEKEKRSVVLPCFVRSKDLSCDKQGHRPGSRLMLREPLFTDQASVFMVQSNFSSEKSQ